MELKSIKERDKGSGVGRGWDIGEGEQNSMYIKVQRDDIIEGVNALLV